MLTRPWHDGAQPARCGCVFLCTCMPAWMGSSAWARDAFYGCQHLRICISGTLGLLLCSIIIYAWLCMALARNLQAGHSSPLLEEVSK